MEGEGLNMLNLSEWIWAAGQGGGALALAMLAALVGGFIRFLSPCVLPLVPPYLCFMAGTSFEDFTTQDEAGKKTARRVLHASFAFVAGLGSVLIVLLGFGATLIGNFLLRYKLEFAIGAGVILIIFGLHFLGIFRIGLLHREARFNVGHKPVGLGGAYLLGLAFAFGWTPCIGPILAGILALAASQDSGTTSIILLTLYTIGLGLPFILAAAFIHQFMRFSRRFKRHMRWVEAAMGVLLIMVGLLLITDEFNTISYWMLEKMPWLSKVG